MMTDKQKKILELIKFNVKEFNKYKSLTVAVETMSLLKEYSEEEK